MKKENGRIENINNGSITGWVYSSKSERNYVVILGNTVEITDLKFRQDVLDAGYGDGVCGFELDIQLLVSEQKRGGFLDAKLYSGEKLINTKQFSVPSSLDFNLNCYFDIENKHSMTDHQVKSANRLAWRLETYPLSNNLSSSKKYTRINIETKLKSQMNLTIIIKLDNESIKSAVITNEFLRLVFLVRASNHSTGMVNVESASKQLAIQEPLSFTPSWKITEILLDQSIFRKAIENRGELKVVLPNDGSSFFDVALIKLSEKPNIHGEINESDDNYNILHPDTELVLNGGLQNWNNGYNFTKLKRGQEIADFWFFESSKQNIDNIRLFAQPDNEVDDITTLKAPRIGLRAITTLLKGYARVLVKLSATEIRLSNYCVKLKVSASGQVKKALIPRMSLFVRDSVSDHFVCDVARKVFVDREQEFVFILDKVKVEKIIRQSSNFPVLMLLIDLGSNTDLIFSSVSISAVESSNVNVVNNIPKLNVVPVSELSFEDESINKQLSLLKGLNFWSEAKNTRSFKLPSSLNSNKADKLTSSINDFENIYLHKITRPHSNYPSIDVVIPIYNAHDDVVLCIKSILEKTNVPYQLILINDASDSKTYEMLRLCEQTFPHVTMLHNEQNIGYTKSVNRGIANCNAEWVVVLNSDTIVSECWLSKLMNCALSSGDKVGMVGPLSNAASWQSIPAIHDKNGGWNLNPLPVGITVDLMADFVGELSIKDYPNVKVINGFCQLINMDMLSQIGSLDEVAFPQGYGEENDMCARAVKAGYKLVIADDTYVFHAKSKSFGHEIRKTLSKQGSLALKNKHPDVDWKVLTEEIRDNDALVTLRNNLIEKLNNVSL